MRLVLDTNILIDYAIDRQPFAESAGLLMELGYLRELELWIGTSQVSDLVYVITDGGRPAQADYAKETMRKLRRILHIYATDEEDYDAVAASAWDDLEDAFVFQTALKVKADAIITRDRKGFAKSPIKIFDCDSLFDWLRTDRGLDYGLVPF